MSNLPLQPMTASPKDGRDVWIMPRLSYFCVCRWSDEEESWISLDGDEFHDTQVNGWLDIEALQRDSARLTKLIDRFNFSEAESISALFDDAYEIAAHGSGDTENYQQWVRAAIDKELGR